ncbi:hypothetical protein [Geodermatophilus sp. SYSU D01176]
MTSQLVDLRGEGTWDVPRLLTADVSLLWNDIEVRRLGEVAEIFGPTDLAVEDEPLIRPGDVNLRTGAVASGRRASASRPVLRVQAAGRGARPGDVLVPLAGDRPCVLLSAEHSGLAFANFAAMRPMPGVPAAWLWAVLSSQRGLQLRQGHSAGTVPRPTLMGLAAMPVPMPPPVNADVYRRLEPFLAVATEVGEPVVRSWWRVTGLPATGDWRLELTTPNPRPLEDGTPLEAYADVVTGRNPRDTYPVPRPGTRPVLNGKSVDGTGVTRFADPSTGIEAQPGDVAVVEVGVRGRVAVVRESAIAGSGVLLLRPRAPEYGDPLARYLGSETGQALRSALVTGMIPRLTRAALEELPVPAEAFTAPARFQPADRRLLAEKLEQVLWG